MHKNNVVTVQFCIFFCSFPLDGKDKAVDVGAIPELVSLLADDNTDVRAQAAGAIMTYVLILTCLVFNIRRYLSFSN